MRDVPQRSPRLCEGWLEWLCKVWIIVARRRKTGDPCVYFPERVINRPDPCLYSQFMLLQLNRPVTWDNPDIAVVRLGVEQPTYDLVADTDYEIVVTVHNASAEKPAPGTAVSIRWVEFGAGGQIRHPIDDVVIDVPQWPGTATAQVPWQTPAMPGHYCIEVQLTHPQDANPTNNLGWNNTVVKSPSSPIEMPIRIFNRWLDGGPAVASTERERRDQAVPWNLVEVVFDSYVFHDAYGDDADAEVLFAARAPAWTARIEPGTFHFGIGDTYRDVVLTVEVPSTAAEPERFNVSAFQGGTPLGGVTVTVEP